MESDHPLSPRRRQILDAAVRVISDAGLRGLTHRAVDRQAGLPEGSTSAYLRTRAALQGALTDYVAARLGDDVERLAVDLGGCSGDEQAAVALTAQLFLDWLEQPDFLLARLELTLAASREEHLVAALTASRTRLIALVDSVMADRGKEHDARRAETLVASLDGILVAALLKPRRERRAFVTNTLALLMGSLGGHPA